jgi:pyridoxine/pyridoxamine 5'-phosphate oxidase
VSAYIATMTSIASLRKSYEHAEPNAEASEPNAKTLTTAGSNFRLSTRVGLIMGLGAQGIAWYTNHSRRKGQ